jgi:hypothetical protein
MAKRGGGGESSNTGLIVALVFFVLLSIGLGVGTYMGYGGKAESDKAAKAASDKAAAADKKAEEAEARRLAVKIAAGVEDPADKARFAGIKSTYATAIDGDVGQFYTQAATKLNVKNLPRWNPAATDQPPKTLIAVAEDLQKAANTAAGKEKATVDELAKERESYKAAVEDLQAKLKTAQDNLAKANQAVVAEQNTRAGGSDKKDEDIKKLSEQVQQLNLDIQNSTVEKDREIKKLREQVATSTAVRRTLAEKYGPILERLDQVRQTHPEFRDLADLQDLLKKALEGQSSLVNDTPKGSIVKAGTGQVYINLGSADNVRPGLMFSILPAGSTGRGGAAAARKGAIEVVSVLEPHLAAAKVVEANNPARDPLLAGDLLFNPAWSPTQPEHVAIAGIIDLNGSGTDGTPDLVRALEKQGVVVDAWLDLKDRTIKGPGMSERTSYLIKGERPIIPSNAALEGNPLTQAATDVIGKITEMEQKAQTLGVQPVPYRRFLSLIGYKLPKNAQPADYSSSSYLRSGSTAKPPGEKDKEKDKDKEEKPK